MMIALYILLGVAAGVCSGLLGIGGGIILVPALVFLFGFSQHQAQGTTLAMMVPPIGILAAWTYFRSGDVNVKVALLLCLGFLAGSLIGAKFGLNLSETSLRKVFGAALMLIALKMLLGT